MFISVFLQVCLFMIICKLSKGFMSLHTWFKNNSSISYTGSLWMCFCKELFNGYLQSGIKIAQTRVVPASLHWKTWIRNLFATQHTDYCGRTEWIGMTFPKNCVAPNASSLHHVCLWHTEWGWGKGRGTGGRSWMKTVYRSNQTICKIIERRFLNKYTHLSLLVDCSSLLRFFLHFPAACNTPFLQCYVFSFREDCRHTQQGPTTTTRFVL